LVGISGSGWAEDSGEKHPYWTTITGHSARSFPGRFWQTGRISGRFSTGTGSGPNLRSTATAGTGWISNGALYGLILAWGKCGVPGSCREGDSMGIFSAGDTPLLGVPPVSLRIGLQLPGFPDPEVIIREKEGEFQRFLGVFTSERGRSYIAILQRAISSPDGLLSGRGYLGLGFFPAPGGVRGHKGYKKKKREKIQKITSCCHWILKGHDWDSADLIDCPQLLFEKGCSCSLHQLVGYLSYFFTSLTFLFKTQFMIFPVNHKILHIRTSRTCSRHSMNRRIFGSSSSRKQHPAGNTSWC